MAQYMIDIFGDMLHREPRDETRPHLPSPEELKYKILIKVRTTIAQWLPLYHCSMATSLAANRLRS